jgi:hypothetical protein
LRLSASVESACMVQRLRWQNGPVILSLLAHTVEGRSPRICVWEVGPEVCASVPPIDSALGWAPFHALIQPDPGTTALDLFLYADAGSSGALTVNEYADVRVTELPAMASALVLIGYPEPLASSGELVIAHTTYSTLWQGSANGRHVLVDGMLNGWLLPSASQTFSYSYQPAAIVAAGQQISLVSLFVVLLLTTFGSLRLGSRYAISVLAARLSGGHRLWSASPQTADAGANIPGVGRRRIASRFGRKDAKH